MSRFAFKSAEFITIDGETVPLCVRRNAQAKRLILRIDSATGGVKVTAPPRVPKREIERFIYDHTIWIDRERKRRPRLIDIVDGATLPYLGADRTIMFTGVSPRRVSVDADHIIVGGPKDQAQARLLRWLKADAKESFIADADHFANTLGVQYGRISVGDMKSRWGSCSSKGTLRLNWRLVMAPIDVRRYVVAHEVAHLLEMNHSPVFWAHVAACVPDHKRLRQWLRENGGVLMRFNFASNPNV